MRIILTNSNLEIHIADYVKGEDSRFLELCYIENVLGLKQNGDFVKLIRQEFNDGDFCCLVTEQSEIKERN